MPGSIEKLPIAGSDEIRSDPTPAACLNCGASFSGARPRYCPECGQESTLRPPTLFEFAQQFGGAYLSTEGALWRTLVLLMFKPGELTRRYLGGQRKHYILPLRLYLTTSVVVLLLIRVVLASQVAPELDQAGWDAADEPLSISMLFGRVTMENGVFACEGLPQWLCGRLEKRLSAEPKAVAADLVQAGDRFASHWGTAMFVLMPSFAFGLWVVYRNRRLGYTEHLVFALHLHAFWFIMLALAQIDATPVKIAVLLAVPGYGVLALRRVYGGRWGPLLLRAGVLSAVYLALVLAAIVVLGVIALLA